MTKVIMVRGGIGDIASAAAGEHTWERQPDEPEPEFIDRVRAEASALALPRVVLGGLPQAAD